MTIKNPRNNPVDNVHIHILKKMRRYVELKKNKLRKIDDPSECVLPNEVSNGLCAGLVACWLYSEKINKNLIFINESTSDLENFLEWDADKFVNSQDLTDPNMEQFINAVRFLHSDTHLRTGVMQENIDTSFNFLTADTAPKLAPAELVTVFVFNHAKLAKFIQDIVFEHKMIRLGNGFHTVGLYKKNDKYYFYDPLRLPIELDSASQVATAIFTSLSPTCKSTTHIALSSVVFDLVSSVPAVYPDITEYYTKLLQDETYKHAVLNHNNIFHLAARCADYKTMNLLFDNGYEYIPWREIKNTEIIDAINADNPELLAYLLAKGFVPDYNAQGALTPMGLAIVKNSLHLVCLLVAAGADPNGKVLNDYSVLSCAIQTQPKDNDKITQANIIAVLLGSGAKLSSNNKKELYGNFTKSEVARIFANAAKIEQQVHAADVDWKQFADIEKYFTSKQVNQHSISDFQELKNIFASLDVIAGQNISLFHPQQAYVILQARSTKTALLKYLERNGIKNLDNYLHMHRATQFVRKPGMYFTKYVAEIEPEDFYRQISATLSLSV